MADADQNHPPFREGDLVAIWGRVSTAVAVEWIASAVNGPYWRVHTARGTSASADDFTLIRRAIAGVDYAR